MPLSQKQMEYLALAWQCFETEPKIDYEKFKTVTGLASVGCARETMRITKNKLRDEYGCLSGGVKASNTKGGATATTPRGSRKRGTPGSKGKSAGKAVFDVEDDEDTFAQETPSKKKMKEEAGGAGPDGNGNGNGNGIKIELKGEEDEDDLFAVVDLSGGMGY